MTAQTDDRRPDLTDEQRRAVARRSGQLLLAAGAGSGKTTVLVERFVAAVREDRIAPSRILAITFTERAAGELRARVRARLTELGAREAARDVELAFICTFHAFCATLLRARALLAGLDPAFEILDDGLAARLRDRAFAAALGEFLDGGAARVDIAAAYGPDGLAQMIGATYAQLRSAGERAPRLPRPRDVGEPELDAARTAAQLGALLALFGERYQELKRDRGAVDFDDLELAARDLLRDHEDVRTHWSERFDLLMVDEFQDTNRRQLAILSALARENLFTVGDELQAIYSFRHADVELFRARRAELARRGASLRLTGNFRSRPALLDAINTAFAARFGEHSAPLAPARDETRGESSPRVELLLTRRWAGSEDEPLAREVAAELPPCPLAPGRSSALARGWASSWMAERRAGDVAVLLRAVATWRCTRGAAQQGLSTLATVGGFWERQQVGDLLAYLRALANPLDEPALLGVLASPLVGVPSGGARAACGHAAKRANAACGRRCAMRDDESLGALGAREAQLLGDFRGALRASAPGPRAGRSPS